MAESTTLATREQQAISIVDQMAFAQEASSANIIPEVYRGKPANVLIAVGFGQSMGLSPAESLYRINVIKGKPTASAELIAAQVRKAGHKLRLSKDEGAQSVTCTIVRADDPKYPISVTRDKAWATSMGLAGNDNYRKQGMTMLTWRAITACAREACPEALYGVAYTPDEMYDMDAPEERQPQPKPTKAVDVQPIRDRYKAWCAATGHGPKDGMGALLAQVGAISMQELTQEQVEKAVALMDAQTASQPAQGPTETPQADEPVEPDLYDADQEF